MSAPPPSNTQIAPPPATSPPPEPPATSPPPSTQPPTISPPAPKTGFSPPAHSSGNRVSPPSGGDDGLSTGLVIGTAVFGLLASVVFTIICMCCCNKKKKRERREQQQPAAAYNYMPPPLPPKDNPYGAGAPVNNWQDNVAPPVDHMVNIPPNPPPRVPKPPTNLPLAPPPPPPAYVSSSGGSGLSDWSDIPLPPPSPGVSLGLDRSSYTYEELAMATDGFSDANLLGQGGFGYVHRGVLSNGKEVAVKQLKAGSRQGEREFQTEVEVISTVHHKHLVSLVGYCMTGSRRMLVYEFVPNNNLEFHLHGKGRPLMDWRTRLKIALGSAKGLSYLHEDCNPKIIHRDIKASNILLDFNFEAKVADFGLAKITSDTNTHVSTRVMGTVGYLAPEYAASGKLTEKSDVFSFGVVLLELITGHRPVDSGRSSMDDSLVDWARPLLTRALEDGNFGSFVDRRIRYNHNEMARMVACAAACVRHAASRRPRMGQIVRALEGDVSLLSDYNEIITPGQSTVYSSQGSSEYDSVDYNENMRKFREKATGTKEYGNSDIYSNPTSEYSVYPSGSSIEGQETREMEMGKMKGFQQ